MTRRELTDIIGEECFGVTGSGDAWIAAGIILAALERERETEVVLGEGEITRNGDDRRCWTYIGGKDIDLLKWYELCGKQGQLIFRPTKAEKGGG